MRIVLLVLVLVGGCVPYGAGYYGTAYYPAVYPAYQPAYQPAYPVYAPGPYTGGYAMPPSENCGTPEVFKRCVR